MSFCYHNLAFISPTAAANYMLTTGLEWGRSEMEDAALDVRKCLSKQGENEKTIEAAVTYALHQFDRFEKREKKKLVREEAIQRVYARPSKTRAPEL
jgi:hypothetical protein